MKKFLKPKSESLKVANPKNGRHLDPKGEFIEITTYWQRMINCGDVVESKQEPKAKKVIKKDPVIKEEKPQEIKAEK